MRKHKPPQKHGNQERWLITYADMITLLLIFFIVMYTMSQIDIKKFQFLSESLTKVMGGGGMLLDSPGPSVVQGLSGTEMQSQMDSADRAQLEALRQELAKQIAQSGLNSKVSVSNEERGIVLSFQEDVLFKLGSADLTDQARGIIGKIAPVLLQSPNYIRIEGHTDNLPISTAKFPSNWELSSARAINVLQYIIHKFNFPPERLAAAGYGEYRPRVPNNSAANRQLNRRVDVVILRSKFRDAEPSALPSSAHETVASRNSKTN